MLSPLRISSSVSSPFPSEFTLHPLLRSERLSAIAEHQFFYASFFSIALLWIVYAVVPWSACPISVEWVTFALCQVLAWGWCIVAMTQVDRRILWLLFRSFEYIFLLIQACTISICLFVQSQAIFVLCGFVLMLSLDALVGASSRGKGLALLAFLMQLLYLLVYHHMHPTEDPVSVTIFFYRTTVDSISGSATVTLILFVSKYMFYILFRPGKMLILSSNVSFSVKRDATFEAGDAALHRAEEMNEPLMDVVVQE
jgi:hypothetical protein